MRKGFTLIEILVVISIIAILASSVLIGLVPVRRQGRDARRISDLRQIQNGLELYSYKCGYYPGAAAPSACPSSFTNIGPILSRSQWSSALSGTLTGSTLGISQEIPNDPTASQSYFYGTNAAGTSYVLGALLEDPNNPVLQSGIKVSTYGVPCDQPNMYCLSL